MQKYLRAALLCACAAWLVLASMARASRACAQADGAEHTPASGLLLAGTEGATSGGQSGLREYQRVMALGIEEYDAGRWAEARALFLRGHALLPNARSFRVLAMTAFNLQLYPDALRELTSALNDARRPLVGSLRKATQELWDRANTFVGIYRVRSEPASVEFRVDGFAAKLEPDGRLLLPVGSHVVEVEAPQFATLARPLVVDGTDGESLRFQLRPLAPGPLESGGVALVAREPRGPLAREANAETAQFLPPSSQRSLPARVFGDYRWSWISGTGMLAAGAAASALYVRAAHEQASLERRCALLGCYPWNAETERRDTLRGWSTGFLVGSVALAASTLVLVLVEHERARGDVKGRDASRPSARLLLRADRAR